MDLYTKLQEVESSVVQRMTEFEAMLSSHQSPHTDLGKLSQDFIAFRNLTLQTLNMLRSQMELVLLGLDRHEMASRRKVLLFHGIPESDATDPATAIVGILTNQMKVAGCTEEDLTACYRLGSNTNKPRPILVRFLSLRRCNEVWKNKTLLKGSRVIISEFLTKSRHDVFLEARSHFGVKRCWTTDGKIIVLLPDNKRSKIEQMFELQHLKTKFPSAQKAQGAPQSSGKSHDEPKTAPKSAAEREIGKRTTRRK